MSVKLDFLSQIALIEIIGSGEDETDIIANVAASLNGSLNYLNAWKKIQVFPQNKQNMVKSRQNLLIFLFLPLLYLTIARI